MSNSADSGRTERTKLELAGDRMLGLARSWQVGALLFTVALVFVGLGWRTVDFSGLVRVTGVDLALAGVAYVGAVAAMAGAALIGHRGRATNVLGSALATQVLKYVPGTVWQGQRMFALGGAGAVGRFAGAVLAAAGLGLIASGHPLTISLGAALVAGLGVGGFRFVGSGDTVRLGVLALLIALGLATSGAFLGPGLGLSGVEAGRDVVAAWGLGVVAVPVPAGLGIRELYFSMTTSGDAAAQLAVAHRALTIGIDLVLGVVGFRLSMRSTGDPA